MKQLLCGALVLALASATIALPQTAPAGGKQPSTQTGREHKGKKGGTRTHTKQNKKTGSNLQHNKLKGSNS